MMSKQIEALKLALEAIEACLSAGTEAEDQDASDKLCDAYTAIREALAEQPARRQNSIEPIEFLSGFLTERLAIERGIEWTPAIHDLCNRAIEEEKLAEQPAQQQEPVACAVCNEVHAILDADASRIIRNAADGYPEGRAPRVLTLQERVAALCVYAVDWRRWCLEKENAPPASKPWVGLTDEDVTWLCNTAKSHEQTWGMFVRAIEAKLKEKNT